MVDPRKIEALRLISEFQHEINKIVRSLESKPDAKIGKEILGEYVSWIGKRENGLIASEIAFCLKDGFDRAKYILKK